MGAGGEGLDGCPGLKLIAAFVQQDFQIEAFDNKESPLPVCLSPCLSLTTLILKALTGLCGRAALPGEKKRKRRDVEEGKRQEMDRSERSSCPTLLSHPAVT